MSTLKNRVQRIFNLQHDKASDEEIRRDIINGANIKGTNMFILMIAIFIASIGLNMNSTAVIIGAMLISPLMGGIMAIGFGMATNDLTLVKKAFMGLCLQIVICLVTSTLYFAISPISSARSEILARTNPTIWDVLIAFFGGLAGSIGVTRKEKTNVIPGVAIATALMPPLCTVGYGIATSKLHIILGAFYLFFINSFFICVSSYIITKLIHIPKQHYMDEKKERRVQRYIYMIGIIIIIPSVFLAYQIVTDTVFENNVQRYLNREMKFEDTQVVHSYVTDDKKSMVVALLGKRLSDDTIDLLEQKLKQYNLGDMHLKVTQTETGDSLSVSDIQALVEQELDAASTENNLLSNNNELEVLKSELVSYKSRLLEYENKNYDTKSLGDELHALFPGVQKFSIVQADNYDLQTGTTSPGIIAVIKTREVLTETDQARIRAWIKVKTGVDEISLYINKMA